MARNSTAAQCAKAIKAELRAAYPRTVFSVTSEYFAGGNAVRVRWEDGPTTREVGAITGKYQYGHFNGMIDSYEFSNRNDDIPQVMFITTRREYSLYAWRQAVAHVNAKYGYHLRLVESGYPHIDPQSDEPINNGYNGWASSEVSRYLRCTSQRYLEGGIAFIPMDRG